MTCNVTGTAISPNGLIKPGARITFRRAQLDVVSQEGSFVIPDDYIIQTASDGTVDFDILPGVYDATTVAVGVRNVAFRVSVPDEPAADFADLLNASYVEIPPASVTQAQQARDEAEAAAAQAEAAAAQAALYDGPWFDTVAALLADTTLSYTAGQPTTVAAGDYVRTRAEGVSYEVAAPLATDHHITTAGGVKLYASTANAFITPRMFGAAGDGVADDLLPVRACWDFGGANNIPVHMEGLEYNCSDAVFTSSNLTIHGQGAVMYVTAWPAVGGFINNVRPVVAERVQSNIRIYDLVTDGSKLPPGDGSTQNTNLGPEFARGASNVRVVNCTARKCPEGYGSGTGGGGFGGEQGLTDVLFLGCVAEDCYRGVRVAGIPGEHAPGVSKEATGVVFRDFTARRCGAAILCHSIGHAGDDQSDLSIFDALFDGVYIEDCGHMPWFEVDFVAYPAIYRQKTGAIVLAGAQNVRFRSVRVKLGATYPETFTDWLGRSGYPAAGSGDFIGAGLSGKIGALVWGWGRNIIFEDITLDGAVDVFWRCHRAVAFGEMSSVSPTFGAEDTVQQLAFENVRHVRAGPYQYVFDGQSGLDNAKFGARMRVYLNTNPSTGVIGPNGTAALTNLLIKFVQNNGPSQEGNAVQWLGAGNIRPVAPNLWHSKGGYDVGGGYSSSGANKGQSYDPASGILRSSQNTAGAGFHLAFYNPNALVGSIQTIGSSTVYATTSDARLKDDLRDFDGLGMIRAIAVYDHAWRTGGRGFGVIAQEAAEIVPHAVSVGDSDDDWNCKVADERVPWSVDYSKLVPMLIRAVQQLVERLDNETQ